MKTTYYKNRYGDRIKFKETAENKIEMSGYNPEWLRAGWPNDYSEAYEAYLNNSVSPLPYQEFVYEVEHNEEFFHYLTYAKSDKSRYDMVDPSGGPYISLGTNIGNFFKDNVKRIVEEIQIDKDKIIFTISNEN